MIEEPRRGLLSLLDEEGMLPQGTDEAYASKAYRVRETNHTILQCLELQYMQCSAR